MTIRGRLLAAAILPAAMLLAVGAVAAASLGRLEAARRQHATASGVVKGAFQLTLLTYEYLQQHSERSREQWLGKHATMSIYLSEAEAARDVDQALLQSLRTTHKETGRLFRRLVGARSAGATTADEFSAPIEQRLNDQLLTRSHEMLSLASRLASGADAYMDRVFRWTGAFVLASAALCAAAVAAIALMVRRSVVKPLASLHAGLRDVGAGKLDVRLNLQPENEIGELACAFDRMAAELQTVTVSRDDLARETVRRAAAEEHLRATLRQLQERNRELEQFAWAAAHDLQEPLRKIQAFGDRLVKECAGAEGTPVQDYAERMRRGAERMSRLLNDLLVFTRVGSGGRTFGPVDLKREADQAAADLAPAIRAANARVTIGPLPEIEADADEMWLLFRSLLDNAVKFRKPGHSPEVRVTGRLCLNGERPRCVIEVSDDGIGFDPKYAGRLFAIFRRLHPADEYAGTGLGLAVCRKIAEGHDGTIEARSEAGRGATFSVTLPLKQEGKGAIAWEKPS